MKVIAIIKDSNSEWEEDFIIPSGVSDAHNYIEKIITNFNETLRSGEVIRQLVSFSVSDNKAEKHQWDKMITNMSSEAGCGDKYKCKKCGVRGKSVGLGQPKIDKIYKAALYKWCDLTVLYNKAEISDISDEELKVLKRRLGQKAKRRG